MIGEKVAKLHQNIERYIQRKYEKKQKKIIKTKSEGTNVQTEKKLKMPISQQMLFRLEIFFRRLKIEMGRVSNRIL